MKWKTVDENETTISYALLQSNVM